MDSFKKEFEHLVIKLEDIKSATNNFDEKKVIGGGGFGKVYKGEVSHYKGRSMVAFKRLDSKFGQGYPEFWKEIMMLSRYTHENLITLLGYCNEGSEMILVYEHASNGSLDRHLSSTTLTWTQRIKICLDAARGLSYLHEDKGNHQRVIHRDIKSSNILLDENWNSKVSDMGLAKIGPANQQYTVLVTNTVGTLGYLDPVYLHMGILTKESDVYSFGVVLLEVFCGKLCFEKYDDGFLNLVPTWKKSCKLNEIDKLIFKDSIMKNLDPTSLVTFTDIALRCLNKSREERPLMADVVEKLEIALKSQELVDLIVIPKEYEEIVKAAVTPLIYKSVEELKVLLSKGVLVNGGKTWLSLNDKRENHVMISMEDYLILDDAQRDTNWSKEKSRFAVGCYKTRLMELKLRVTAPLFLSPDVTYELSLVLHASEIEGMKQQYVGVRYKIHGETKISIMHFVDKKEGKQLVAKLYQFNNTEDSILDLEIFLEDCGLSGDFYIEGIEFRPLEKMERQVVIANQEIVRGLVPPLFYRFTEEESKVHLSQGVLLNRGEKWLSINEKGEHIERICIEACLNLAEIDDCWLKHPSGDIVNSRFPRGRCYQYVWDGFKARVRGEYLTPHISYTLNLVFRYEDQSEVNSYNPLRYEIDGEAKVFIIYPSTHMREDGWFIVPFYHFTSQNKTADLQFEFEHRGPGLLVAGIEFQPSEEKVELPVFEEYQHIVDFASQSLFYTSLDELKQILSKGVLLNGFKTWFSLNEKGQHCHMISMEDCLILDEYSTPLTYKSDYKSRFPVGLYQTNNKGFTTHVKTQLLSPSITYTVNLVYYSSSRHKQVYVDLKYRLRGEATTSVVYLANQIDDHFHMAELYQFTSDGSIVDLEFFFENSGTDINRVEGILFQPVEKVEDQVSKDDKVENIQTISNSDSGSLMRTTKEKLYSIFRRRSLIDNGQQWVSVHEHGKKCLMLSAKETWVIDDKNSAFESSHESRFGEVLVITAGTKFELVNEIKLEVLSADTTYASYLVYKLPLHKSTFVSPLDVRYKYYSSIYLHYAYSYLVSPPNTPVIGPKFDDNLYNPLNRHKHSSLPRQRSDGWMEVKVWGFQTKKTSETVSMHLKLEHPVKKDLSGLIIYGIELRPI